MSSITSSSNRQQSQQVQQQQQQQQQQVQQQQQTQQAQQASSQQQQQQSQSDSFENTQQNTTSSQAQPQQGDPQLSSQQQQNVAGLADTYNDSATSSPASVGAASAGANDPSIQVTNDSNTTRYYNIQASAGQDPQNLNNTSFALAPGQSTQLNPGAGFNGAITDSATQGGGGTRQELNFGDPSQTWYDSDLEYGNTNSALAPADGRAALDGRSSQVSNTQTPYTTAGAVPGRQETEEDRLSDLGTHTVNTNKFTLDSY